jgi:hypothetical protein
MADDLAAVLEVMAYGYEVTVKINGTDVGIKGGKSESTRLFGADDPEMADLPPEMKRLACLKPGKNQIEVDYKRGPGDDSTGLTIELRTTKQADPNECAFRFREDPDSAASPGHLAGAFEA